MIKIRGNKKILIVLGVIFIFLCKNKIGNNVSFNEFKIKEEDQIPVVESQDKTLENTLTTIKVDLKGAVNNPGVYELEEGARVIDLIEEAGGMVDANENCVNLSHKLVDEEVIVIYPKGTTCENYKTSTQNITGSDSLVNINTADVTELVTLNGIGDTRAEDIIAYREENGNFTNIEDIKNVSGIGDSLYNNIKEDITV